MHTGSFRDSSSYTCWSASALSVQTAIAVLRITIRSPSACRPYVHGRGVERCFSVEFASPNSTCSACYGIPQISRDSTRKRSHIHHLGNPMQIAKMVRFRIYKAPVQSSLGRPMDVQQLLCGPTTIPRCLIVTILKCNRSESTN